MKKFLIASLIVAVVTELAGLAKSTDFVSEVSQGILTNAMADVKK